MNIFDKQLSDSTLAGLGDVDGLGKLKLFKKIKKAVKKVVKKVAKVAPTVLKTVAPVAVSVLPGSKIVKAVAAVVAGKKSATKSTESAVRKIVKVGSAVNKLAKTNRGKKIIGAAATTGNALLATPYGGPAVKATVAGGEIIGAVGSTGAKTVASAIKNVMTDPKFSAVVTGMKNAGVSDAGIKQQWGQSDTFAKIALDTIKNSIQPAVRQELESRGVPPAQAKMDADDQSEYIANETVDKIQQKSTINPAMLLPLLAVPLLLMK